MHYAQTHTHTRMPCIIIMLNHSTNAYHPKKKNYSSDSTRHYNNRTVCCCCSGVANAKEGRDERERIGAQRRHNITAHTKAHSTRYITASYLLTLLLHRSPRLRAFFFSSSTNARLLFVSGCCRCCYSMRVCRVRRGSMLFCCHAAGDGLRLAVPTADYSNNSSSRRT